MAANVFVLASPSPVLYVYPSQLHPTPPVTDTVRGGRALNLDYFNPYPHPLQPRVPKRRRRFEDAVLILGGGTP